MRGDTILIVEDEETLRFSLSHGLGAKGFHVLTAEDGAKGLSLARNNVIDLVLLDFQLPDTNGLKMLEEIKGIDAGIPVIIMTAYGDIRTSVEAMKKGAYDYILKPFEYEEMVITINKSLEHCRLKEEVEHIRLQQKKDMHLSGIVAKCPRMLAVLSIVDKISQTPKTSVLIHGESGVGKEMIANLIHYKSRRASGPFIKINCAAIPATMLEAELFGYEKGAFTDAKNSKKGLFELANGGTILFDEIGEMDINLQPKLLRVIEMQTFMRIGGARDINTDVRIIAITNRDLSAEARSGNFREDLFYRLNVMPIYIPPLRDRGEDIPFLINMFVSKFNREFGKKISGFSEEAQRLLISYRWPGNIRELKNVIERAIILTEGDRIPVNVLPPEIASPLQAIGSADNTHADENIVHTDSLNDLERELILKTLNETNGNRSLAAKNLGISRTTLWKKLKNYGIENQNQG